MRLVHRAFPGSVLTVLHLLLFAGGAHAQLPSGFEGAWSSVVTDWRGLTEREGIVGSSLAFVHGGELVRHEVRGMADLASRRPIGDGTIYHWASITKTFTAIAVMQLRDRGLLTLDDPVVDYVPELREVHNPFGSMTDITIRHLMSHSSGFRTGTWPWGGSETWHPHEPTEWSQLVAMIPYTAVEFEPGSRFSYSNPGIIYLGRIIEKVTGDVYEAYVEKNILRPLGMTRSYFDVTPWHLLPHRSNHYFVGAHGPEAGGLDFNTGITVANGGLNAPVEDLARYLAFLLNSPQAGSDPDVVLRRSSLREMWESVVPMGGSDLGEGSMGLTYFLYQKDGNRVVGHTGSQRAFYSFFYVDPAAGIGVISAYNSGPGEGGHGPDTRAILNRTRADVLDRVFPLFRK